MASVAAHADAETLVRGLPGVSPAIPVLFLHGENSPMPLRASTDTAALIPHATTHILPNAGHFPWHEQPALTREAIAGFVGAESAAPS